MGSYQRVLLNNSRRRFTRGIISILRYLNIFSWYLNFQSWLLLATNSISISFYHSELLISRPLEIPFIQSSSTI